MHLAEGLLPLDHAAIWAGVVAPFVVAGAVRLRSVLAGPPSSERAILGMAGALVFAVTVFPVPVPGVGATSHMCATPVIALLLGPRLLVVPTAICLLLQAVFLAHGGLTTLGANTLTLGVVGPWVAWGLARALRAFAVRPIVAAGVACLAADAAVYVLDASILGLALAGERPWSHWFRVTLTALAPIQGPLAVLEGLLSAWLVAALARRRADLVPDWLRGARRNARAVAGAAVAAVVLALPATARANDGAEEPPAVGSDWVGADEGVFEKAAAEAGRTAAGPVIDVERGDLGLFVFSLAAGVAGFVVGRGWERLARGGGDVARD